MFYSGSYPFTLASAALTTLVWMLFASCQDLVIYRILPLPSITVLATVITILYHTAYLVLLKDLVSILSGSCYDLTFDSTACGSANPRRAVPASLIL